MRAGPRQPLPRAGRCPQGSCIQPLQKWGSAIQPEQVCCYGWVGTPGQVQARYGLIGRSHPVWKGTARQAVGKALSSLATIFKSTFTPFFSPCMTQIKCKHQPVITKANHCSVALCFAVASEIISTPFMRKSPLPSSAFDPVAVRSCCLWWAFDLPQRGCS